MINFPRVIIQILHFKDINDTLECLDSVFKLDYPNFQILVIDNSGKEIAPEPLLEQFNKQGRIELIKTDENKGFAGGHNIGFNWSIENDADYVWVLNNDCVVLPDTLQKLVDDIESNSAIGAVSPVIYYYGTESIQHLASIIDLDSKQTTSSHSFKQLEAWEAERRSFCLWGTALFVRLSVIKEIGFFDDKYFAYWEDMDISYRILKKSYINKVTATSMVFHKDDIKLSKVPLRQPHYYFYMCRNELLFLRKHSSALQVFLVFSDYFKNTLSRLSNCLTFNDEVCANALLDGFWHGLHGYGGPWEKNVHMPNLMAKILKKFAWRLYRLLSIFLK